MKDCIRGRFSFVFTFDALVSSDCMYYVARRTRIDNLISILFHLRTCRNVLRMNASGGRMLIDLIGALTSLCNKYLRTDKGRFTNSIKLGAMSGNIWTDRPSLESKRAGTAVIVREDQETPQLPDLSFIIVLHQI